MTDAMLIELVVREIRSAIRAPNDVVIHQKIEVGRLMLTGQDATHARELLDNVASALFALNMRLATIDSGTNSAPASAQYDNGSRRT
jgi:hypothetical protein